MNDHEEPTISRRGFLDGALAAASVTAVADVLAVPAGATAAPASPPACPPSDYFPNAVPVAGSANLRKIGEITSNGNKLQAIITVRNRKQDVPTGNAQNPIASAMLRYFEGHRPDGTQQWPSNCSYTGNNPPPGPGPTLRGSLGDLVQMALINRVNTGDFPHTLDLVERGLENGCDVVRPAGAPTSPAPVPSPGPNPTRAPNVYPANDRFPDCLHGSSSANIHFHGTHVSPSTTGDNVLINVRPFATPQAVSEREIVRMFTPIWRHCELGHEPRMWDDLPHEFRTFAERQLQHYDRTAPYAGKNGNLPYDQWLWPQNHRAIKAGEWPQWYVGAYPYCFQIPPAEQDGKPRKFVMGQAPGTHWYHSHKHGSTAINMFNGMSGALIIQDPAPDGYDKKLHAFYAGQAPGLQELVLVLQQIISTPNLLTSGGGGRSATLVNGQFAPTITMQPGQVQLWRTINACVVNAVPMVFKPATTTPAAPPITYMQTAQDGVQFAWDTFNKQDTAKNPITLATANRADLLVRAPNAPGTYTLQDGNGNLVLYVNVTGNAISPAMTFPKDKKDWPRRPAFLDDIVTDDLNPPADEQQKPWATIYNHRAIVYGWEAGRTAAGKNPALPHFTINGEQFTDGRVNEVMLLDTSEEWTVVNATTQIAHPFHIHINPFQIIEIFIPTDPTNANPKSVMLPGPWVWWDTFAIPPGIVVKQNTTDPRTGKIIPANSILPGYFRMRTRFVDFTGKYVQHCHILTHEDRGMMQLLEVVTNKSILKHH